MIHCQRLFHTLQVAFPRFGQAQTKVQPSRNDKVGQSVESTNCRHDFRTKFRRSSQYQQTAKILAKFCQSNLRWLWNAPYTRDRLQQSTLWSARCEEESSWGFEIQSNCQTKFRPIFLSICQCEGGVSGGPEIIHKCYYFERILGPGVRN